MYTKYDSENMLTYQKYVTISFLLEEGMKSKSPYHSPDTLNLKSPRST